MMDIVDDKENKPPLLDLKHLAIEEKRQKVFKRLNQRTPRLQKESKKLQPQKFRNESDVLQMNVLSAWINNMLAPPDDAEIQDQSEIENLLKKDTNRQLQEMLTTFATSDGSANPLQKKANKNRRQLDTDENFHDANFFKYFLKCSSQKSLHNKAKQLMLSSKVPEGIVRVIKQNKLFVRNELNVFSNLGIQAMMCRVLLSFQPIWLRLALETVFDRKIDFSRCAENKLRYPRIISSFILHNLLADFSIVEHSKKYAFGQQKRLLTPAGVDVMHKNFLSKFLIILHLIELFVTGNLMPSVPCMFWPSSQYKSISDVLVVLSRELLSGASSLKSLQSVGFYVAYKQGFFEEFSYVVNKFETDLCDGIILAKLVEIVSMKNGKTLSLIDRLRNPSGDRLRKVSNVRVVLVACQAQFSDRIRDGDFQAEDIVAGKYETLVEFIWRLVSIFVGDEIASLRKEFSAKFTAVGFEKASSSLPVSKEDDLSYLIEMKRLNKAASCIQKWWRKRHALLLNRSCDEKDDEIDIQKESLFESKNVDSEKASSLSAVKKEDDLLDLIEMRRFNKAAIRIQTWWRKRHALILNEKYNKKGDEIASLRNEFSPKFTAVDFEKASSSLPVSNEDELLYLIEMRRLNKTAILIQRWWKKRHALILNEKYNKKGDEMISLRNEFSPKFTAVDFEKASSSLSVSKEDDLSYLIEMKRLNKAAIRIQRWWRKRRALFLNGECNKEGDEIASLKNEFSPKFTAVDFEKASSSLPVSNEDDLLYLIEMKRLNEAVSRIQTWWRKRHALLSNRSCDEKGNKFGIKDDELDSKDDKVASQRQFLFKSTDTDIAASSWSPFNREVDQPHLIEAKAANRIQTWWKKRRTSFLNRKCSKKNDDFDEMSSIRKRVLKITKKTVICRHMFSTRRARSDPNISSPLSYEQFKNYIDEKRETMKFVGIPMRQRPPIP